MRIGWFFSVVLLLGTSVALAADEPVDTSLSEHVEVRLVTIDVIALDKDGRTVPGLGKESFWMTVDGKDTPIDTVDAYCGETPQDDPKSKKFGDWATPPDLSNDTRRVVLAFDYLHLPTAICPDLSPPGPCMLHTQALRAYQDVLEARSGIQDEEMMVVALTGGLRVEQPFTRDRKAVIATLRRMEYDITLWNGRFEQTTERGFFRSLVALSTLLRVTPGPKAVVLLTAGNGPGDGYEIDFSRLATAASDAQSRIYPVDCQAIISRGWANTVSGTDMKPAERIASFSTEYPAGLPPGLVRLAASTGGRVTASVNDFTIGYARARRDLGCRYTIGFYDRKPQEDKSHTVRVFSKVPGLTIYHASTYSFPSRAARRTMAMEAAYMVPSMFEGGGMRAEVFPIEPKDGKTWDALVAVDFPVPLSMQAKASLTREFGTVLRGGQVVYAKFGRRVTLETKVDGQAITTRRLTFLEHATLPPGKYTLTAVLSDPGSEAPFTAHTDLVVPEIPKQRPFLVGPMIGRRSGPDVVIHGGEDQTGNPADRVGGPAAFRPLLVTETDRTQPLFALTSACVSKKRAKRGPWRLERGLKTATGEAAGVLDDALFPGAGDSTMLCERFLDQVPVSRLRLGAYTFSAAVRETSDPAESIDTRSASFLLAPTPMLNGGERDDPPIGSENPSNR